MNACNIMWLLNEVNSNTEISVKYDRNKHTDSIDIEASKFKFYVEEYGVCILDYVGHEKSVEKDQEIWLLVKDWVLKYFQDIF